MNCLIFESLKDDTLLQDSYKKILYHAGRKQQYINLSLLCEICQSHSAQWCERVQECRIQLSKKTAKLAENWCLANKEIIEVSHLRWISQHSMTKGKTGREEWGENTAQSTNQRVRVLCHAELTEHLDQKKKEKMKKKKNRNDGEKELPASCCILCQRSRFASEVNSRQS